jgi:hypothetical protein
VASDVDSILEEMRTAGTVHFNDLFKVCEHYVGKPRNSGSSHYIFKTPWPGDPRINIQNDEGKAKAYQVRQVLAAIAKLADIQAQQAKKPKPEITADRKPPKSKK